MVALQSLLGLLAFAGRVIAIGRVFSRRLYMATKGLGSPYTHVRPTRCLKDDLSIWLEFLQDFNGSTVRQVCLDPQEFGLFTDAAGSVGFGAFWNNHWWHQSWVDGGVLKNLVLLVISSVSFGHPLGSVF